MLDLLNNNLKFIKLNNDKTLEKVQLFEAIKEDIEYEDEKKNRINYTFKAKFEGIIPNLNIKVNTKNLTKEEAYKVISEKVFDTLTKNNFLSEGIKLIKKIDKNKDIKIVPIYFEEGFIYRVTIGDKTKTFNDSEISTSDFLKNMGYSDRNYIFASKLIDLNVKGKKSNELIDYLLENKMITLDLLKDVAKETKDEDKDKVYTVLYKIAVMNNIVIEKYNLFKRRKNYLEIFKTLNKDDICSKVTMKYLQETFKLNFIVLDPYMFKALLPDELNLVDEKYKKYVSETEIKISKYWDLKEKQFNDIIKKFNLELGIDRIDFLTDTYKVKCFNNNTLKSVDCNLRTEFLKEDMKNMIKQLKSA